MARNRKRRSDQRSSRPADDPASPQGVATARAGRRDEGASPLDHATPDVELAEAQLAAGRAGAGNEAPDDDFGDAEAGAELSTTASAAPAPRGANRLIQFLQGSWRELQRVQWPDRRQVMQATGVVIGFVIVAGVFLGVADFVAGKVVNLILK